MDETQLEDGPYTGDGSGLRNSRRATIKALLAENGNRIVTQTVKDYGLGRGHGVRVFYILAEESMVMPELRPLTDMLRPLFAEGVFAIDEVNGCYVVPPSPIWQPGDVIGVALSSMLYGLGPESTRLRVDQLCL